MTQNVSDSRGERQSGYRTHNGGTLAPLWQKGKSPNPGGMPKNFVKLSDAYSQIAQLPPATIKMIVQTGEFPRNWNKPQCFTYIVAARAWYELRDRPIPGLLAELADRTEGRVPQKINAEVSGAGILVLPVAQMGSLAWRDDVIDAQAIETKALSAGDHVTAPFRDSTTDVD